MAHTDEFKRKLRLGTACTLLSVMGVAGLNPALAQSASSALVTTRSDSCCN